MWQNCGDAAAKREPGMERPVQKGSPVWEKYPYEKAALGKSENEVAKHVKPPPGKAAIVRTEPVPETDTGG